MSFTANLKLPLMPDTPQEGVTGLDLRKMINGENEDSMAQILDKIIEPNTNKATATDNETMPDDDNKFPTCALVNKVLSNIGNILLEKTVIFEKRTISGFSDGNTGNTILEGVLLPIIDGETYIVNWDEVEYECVAGSLVIDGINSLFLGNIGIGNSDFEDTGEPFAIATASFEGMDMISFISENTTVDSHIVAIYQEQKTITGLPEVTTTDNGKVLGVVDGQWAKMDAPNGCLSGNFIEILPETTLNNFEIGAEGAGLTKSGVDFSLVANEQYTVIWDGVEYKIIAKDIAPYGATFTILGNASLISEEEENTGEPFLLYSLSEQTIYATNDITKDSHTVAIYQESTVNYLTTEDKEELVKLILDNELFSNNEMTFTHLSTINRYTWHQIGSSAINFIPGETYYVEWDGKFYKCIAGSGSMGGNTWNGIGNTTLVGIGEDTGEPFGIVYNLEFPQNMFVSNDTEENTHSVKIYQKVSSGTSTESGSSLPEVTESDNGKHLEVENGVWTVKEIKTTEQVQSDWNETDTSSPAYIKNKPVISAGGGASVQANWEQTDETQADFIKNKPFYEYEGLVDILPLTQYDGFFLNPTLNVYCQIDSEKYSLTVGDNYIVTWDGVDYECVAQDASTIMSGGIALGNLSSFGLSGNNEPFVIAYMAGSNTMYVSLTDIAEGGSHSVRIYGGATLVKHLDNKYLSFMNCESKDIELLPLTQYDGFLFMSDFGAYAKEVMGSDLYSLTLGETYVITWDGVDYECVAQDASSLLGMPGMIGVGNGTSWGLSGNNEPFAFITISGIGAQYFSLTDIEDGGSHSVRVMQYGVITEKIDKEYLPIPFFGEVDSDSKILIDGTYEFDVENDGFAFIPKTSNTYLVEGQEYVMVFNGVEYTSAAIRVEGLVAIGDVDIILNGTSNGIPFVIIDDIYGMVTGGTPTFICLPTSDSIPSLTFDLKVSNSGIVKIDDKYLTQSDWNENDKSSAAYIKNKPFGVIPKGTVIMDIIADCNNTAGDGLYFAYINKIDIGNYSYNFEINGTLYGGIETEVFSNGNIKISFGNKTGDIYFEIYKENSQSESNIIYYFGSKTYGKHSVKLILNEDVYQTIDPKFIPEIAGSGLPEVTTSDAGKFLRVGSNGTWIVEAIQDVSEVGL